MDKNKLKCCFSQLELELVFPVLNTTSKEGLHAKYNTHKEHKLFVCIHHNFRKLLNGKYGYEMVILKAVIISE